jgi:hypothetical protein
MNICRRKVGCVLFSTFALSRLYSLVVAKQRPRDGRIYQGRFWTTARKPVPAETDTNATMEELCFIFGPCRDIINQGQG